MLDHPLPEEILPNVQTKPPLVHLEVVSHEIFMWDVVTCYTYLVLERVSRLLVNKTEYAVMSTFFLKRIFQYFRYFSNLPV